MGMENLETNAQSPEQEVAKEFQRILQSDDIAPVDAVTYGERLAEIILNALKCKLPWSED
jgi:hypothetical protein